MTWKQALGDQSLSKQCSPECSFGPVCPRFFFPLLSAVSCETSWKIIISLFLYVDATWAVFIVAFSEGFLKLLTNLIQHFFLLYDSAWSLYHESIPKAVKAKVKKEMHFHRELLF